MTAPGRPAHGCTAIFVISAAIWPLILGVIAWAVGTIGKVLQ